MPPATTQRRRRAAGLASLGLALVLGPAASTTSAGAPASEIDARHPPSMAAFAIDSAGDRMNAMAYLANGPGPHPTAILLHGLPGNERNLDLAQALRTNGWNAVFFHYRGSWGSEGTFSFGNALADVRSALDHVTAAEHAGTLRVDSEPLALVGHSLGGLAAFHALPDPRVTCAVGVAPWDVAAHLDLEDPAASLSWVDGLLPLVGFSLAGALEELTANRDAWDLRARLESIDKPLLMVTGELDDTLVPDLAVDPARRRSRVEIAAADHSFSARRAELISAVGTWLDESCR